MFYLGPGHWNDPDMLEVGIGGLTLTEQRAHFTMWAMLAAPLIAGNDLRIMTKDVVDILTAPEVIAVDQDRLGSEGIRVKVLSSGVEVWVKRLADSNARAVALFNPTNSSAPATVLWSDVGLNGSVKVRDLWSRQDLGIFKTSYSTIVPSHGAVLIKATQVYGRKPNAYRVAARRKYAHENN